MSDALVGRTIGPYQIVGVIGRGGLATVYKAIQPSLDRLVAIKVLHPHLQQDEEFEQRLRTEAAIAGRLRHPNVLTVYDAGVSDGLAYVVMDFADGRSLDIIIRERSSLVIDYVVEIFRQVGSALTYLHGKGLVHRDVKPSNILTSSDGRVFLSDFGLAQSTRQTSMTMAGTIIGTPTYMAPEMARGDPIDARGDQYALGVVLYELLAGRPPFEDVSSIAVLFKHVHDPAPPLRQFSPRVSEALEGAVLKALAKDPDQRYQTVDEFVEAVVVAARGSTAGATLPLPPQFPTPGPTEPTSREVAPHPTSDISIAGSMSPSAPRSAGNVRAVLLGLLALLIVASGLLSMLVIDRSALPPPETPIASPMPIGTPVVTPPPPRSSIATLLWIAVVLVGLGSGIGVLRLRLAARSRSRGDGAASLEGMAYRFPPMPSWPPPTVADGVPADSGASTAIADSPLDGFGTRVAGDLAFATIETLPYTEPPVPSTSLLADESGAMASLLILTGPERGRQHRLANRTILGRSPSADLVIHDIGASRHHARIALEEGRFYLEDLGSRNGAFVNGARVTERQVLRDRDEIRVGTMILLFTQAIGPEDLTSEAKRRVRDLDAIWERLAPQRATHDREAFAALTEQLVDGLLREAIGYQIERRVPYYRGVVGFMVEAPMLWIRRSRFPLLFVAYDRRNPNVLADVVAQLEMAGATEYFALLVVVPTHDGTGNEAEELRHLVADSIYRHDFVVLDRQHLTSIVAHNNSRRLIEIILAQGIELASLSPYVVLGPVPEGMFFGRAAEIKEISQTILQVNHAIVGGRRIGKSSIMHQLNRLLNNDPRFRAVYLNCEGQFDRGDFLRDVGEELGHPMLDDDPVAFRSLVARLRSEAPPRHPVFLLDEVDELLHSDASAESQGQLFKVFRALSAQGLCHFVFSGSRTLRRHIHDSGSPFFNFCREMVLRPISERSVVEIVSRPMRQLGIELVREDELTQRMIDLTSCHPSLVQWLCDGLLRKCMGRRITPEDLDALAGSLEFGRYYVETAWGTSTPLERLITLVASEPTFELDDVDAWTRNHGVTSRKGVRDALDVLEMCSLLQRQGRTYRFSLAQFPRIVREVEDIPSLVEALVDRVTFDVHHAGARTS